MNVEGACVRHVDGMELMMRAQVRESARRVALGLVLALMMAVVFVVSAPPSYAADMLPAPNFWQPSSDPGYVQLRWDLDYDDTGDNPLNPDEELIDHFNVYCDGRLVARVDISVAEEEVWYNDNSRHHTWWFTYDPGDSWTPHNFQVSSVAKDGTEGHLSEVWSAQAQSYDVEIVGHQANVEMVYDSDAGARVPRMFVDFYINSYYSVETIDIWRSEGMTSPDTSAQPYASFPRYQGGSSS